MKKHCDHWHGYGMIGIVLNSRSNRTTDIVRRFWSTKTTSASRFRAESAREGSVFDDAGLSESDLRVQPMIVQ